MRLAVLSGGKRLSALYSAAHASLQRFNSYSTSNSPRLSNPRSQQPDAINKLVVCPKPAEIPYQAKVVNSVNFIGYVKAPIQFHKHYAATLISQNDSLSISVVFEGDLAHAVASHVKENDYVLVSGQLSSEPTHFTSVGKLRLVGENLNFVKGFKRGVSGKKLDGSIAGGGVENPTDGGIGNVVNGDFNQTKEDAKVKKSSVKEEWASSYVSHESKLGSDDGATLGFVEAKPVSGMKKKDGVKSLDLWKDLVKNSLLWWDYRDHKAKGIVKEKHPDFKHKETGDALWVDSAPNWVLQGLGNLEFDVQVIKVQGSGGNDKDYWKDLVENPMNWWDNRTNKRNPKAPDFMHKETGKGLWLSTSPDWASTRLPQLK